MSFGRLISVFTADPTYCFTAVALINCVSCCCACDHQCQLCDEISESGGIRGWKQVWNRYQILNISNRRCFDRIRTVYLEFATIVNCDTDVVHHSRWFHVWMRLALWISGENWAMSRSKKHDYTLFYECCAHCSYILPQMCLTARFTILSSFFFLVCFHELSSQSFEIHVKSH